LSDYQHSLSIVIRAAGTTGDEEMELQIDGVTVKSWNELNDDAYEGVFKNYIYETDEAISADRVRVRFTNDLYQQGVIDRNLRVDYIKIGEVKYETESSTVFSTGTWKADDGVTPGFRESEYLTSNGYFQYSSLGASPLGSLIEIQAAGDLGTEIMQLAIAGEVVQTWTGVGGNPYAREFETFRYRADGPVALDDIQIYFTNDLFEFGKPDRNLHIDRILIDGVAHETEDATVFSTGTYLSQDGIVPGFRRSETLHAEGFFQFSTPETGTGSLISILAASDLGSERMELRINDQVVKSWAAVSPGAGPRTFQTYNFRANGVVTADQIKLAFTNDLFLAGRDRNLRIDKIVLDGVVFEAEDATVFSTGSWKSTDGILPGYRESEYLNTNGFFQFQARVLSPGVVTVGSSVVNVKEGDAAATLQIVRSQGTDGFVSVDYSTFASSATSGDDFTQQSGTITFAPGETIKLVQVNLVNDAIAEANESFGFAIDNVTGGALLLAPRTGLVNITDDDVLLPTYPNFAGSTTLQLNGAAAIDAGRLNVTASSAGSTGSAFFASPIPISGESSFQTSFQFDINAATTLSPDSGLLFVIQNGAQGAGTHVNGQGTLGYLGTTNSLAVQFDTRLLVGTPTENTVKLLANGSLTPLATGRTPLVDFISNTTAYAWIDYHGGNDRLRVYVSDTPIKPVSPVLSETIDLASLVGNQAFVGFTADNGTEPIVPTVRNWSLNLDQPSAGSVLGGAPGLLSETIVSGLFQPIAIDWSPDALNLYIAQKDGVVQVIREGVKQATPFIDISAIVNTSGDRGLSDIAVHPDFVNSPYVYLLFTYDPPEVNDHLGDPNAGPDGDGNRAGRLIRVTADAATNYTSYIAGSEVIILGSNSVWENFNGFVNSTIDSSVAPAGILPDGSNLQDFLAADSTSHSVDSLMFGPDGALYVSIGDGTSFNRVDTRAFRVQDIDNLSGKLLRIDPLTGNGLADNPFYTGDPTKNQSKVYQYGFRNPFRFTIDPRDGRVYVGDVGWTNWEEINSGAAGANFGWPFYEGGSTGNQPTIQYSLTPEAIAFYASGQAVTAPLVALNHAADNINALIAGDVYLGSAYPSDYYGDLFFNDLGQGIVRNVSFDALGRVEQIEVFATGTTYAVQIIQGPDGRLYYVDLDDGLVGRWSIV
jgi:glucose/arabinose dehydrogenase